MVSKINAKKMDGSFLANAGKIYGEIGFAGLWAGYYLFFYSLDWELVLLWLELLQVFNGGFMIRLRLQLDCKLQEEELPQLQKNNNYDII
jgi:hypothetical protein